MQFSTPDDAKEGLINSITTIATLIAGFVFSALMIYMTQSSDEHIDLVISFVLIVSFMSFILCLFFLLYAGIYTTGYIVKFGEKLQRDKQADRLFVGWMVLSIIHFSLGFLLMIVALILIAFDMDDNLGYASIIISLIALVWLILITRYGK